MRASFFLRALPAPMPATAPMAEPAAMEGRTRAAEKYILWHNILLLLLFILLFLHQLHQLVQR